MEIKYIGKCLLVETDEKRILVIGDLHLGFEEALNRSGVFVSRQMFDEMISYLDRVSGKIGEVDEVVLLGDVKHVFGSVLKQEWNDVLGLFDYLNEKCKKITIVKGNHDSILEPVVAQRRGVELLDFYIVGEICFSHGHRSFEEMFDKNVKSWILGHAHPAVKISEKNGAKVEKYKCFLVGKFKRRNVVVVPSFAEHNEGSDPRENDLGLAWDFNLKKFDVKIISGEKLKVLDFGKLGKLH